MWYVGIEDGIDVCIYGKVVFFIRGFVCCYISFVIDGKFC